jgi:hypothetical protein
MGPASEIDQLFHRDLTRLIQQISAFPTDRSLWERAGIANCAGNLVLHLEGNLREYIGRQLGGVPFRREREQEFTQSGISKSGLIARIEEVQGLVSAALSALDDERWGGLYPEAVLGRPVSTRLFVTHLHGHLNYHLGQIDVLRRTVSSGNAVDYVGL